METSIWDQILARIETKVNRHSFSTWFKPTAFIADGGRSITIRVPNPLFKDWLTKHYSVVLSEALAEVRRPETSLVFVAEPGAVLPAVTEEPERSRLYAKMVEHMPGFADYEKKTTRKIPAVVLERVG